MDTFLSLYFVLERCLANIFHWVFQGFGGASWWNCCKSQRQRRRSSRKLLRI